MGYSCAAKSSMTLDAIKYILEEEYKLATSNGMPNGGFWEIGREQRDGSITGTVWNMLPDGIHIRRAGSFKIDSDGKIVRFPGLPSSVKQMAENRGKSRYSETFERPNLFEAFLEL